MNQNATTPSRKNEIRLNARVVNDFDGIGDGIRRASKADFSALPENPNWKEVLCLAVLIDGYEVASMVTDEHVQNFHAMKEREFEKSGAWAGSVLELWTVLFYYNRKNHWNEGYDFGEGEKGRSLAISAYHALRTRLMNPGETTAIIFTTTKTTTDEMAVALRTALPGITTAEIQNLQNDELTLQQLKMVHGEMLDSIAGLLYKHDVEGLAFDERDLEYEGEAAKIMLRLPVCASAADCQRVIHEEMIRAFDGRVKPLNQYAELANDVWQKWYGSR